MTEEGKEKKVNIDFEPFKPINTSLYLCDNKFHTEALTALLADDNRSVLSSSDKAAYAMKDTTQRFIFQRQCCKINSSGIY